MLVILHGTLISCPYKNRKPYRTGMKPYWNELCNMVEQETQRKLASVVLSNGV